MADIITMPDDLYVFASARFNLVTVNATTGASNFNPLARVDGPSLALWQVVLNFRPRQGDDVDDLMQFILQLKGGLNRARIYDLYRTARAGFTQPRGKGGTGPVANLAADVAAGAETVTIGNLVTSQSVALKYMDHISLGENLHALVQSGPSDGTGKGTFTIWPPARKGAASGDPVNLVKPTGLFRMTGGDADLSQFGRGHNYSEALSLTFTEDPDFDA